MGLRIWAEGRERAPWFAVSEIAANSAIIHLDDARLPNSIRQPQLTTPISDLKSQI